MTFDTAASVALVISMLLSSLGMLMVRSRVDRLWLTVAAYIAKRRPRHARNVAVTAFDVRRPALIDVATTDGAHLRGCARALTCCSCGAVCGKRVTWCVRV